jgi:hypothetical protein
MLRAGGRRRFLVTAGVIASAALGVTAVGPVGAALAAPEFTVMNTSEAPPDGVYFRNSASSADTDGGTGHGVFQGNRVRLNCFAWGDEVGRYKNRLWYQVDNLTLPTVGDSGLPNSGFLSAHYVDDGTVADQVVDGVEPCTRGPGPAPGAGALEGSSIFFQPKNHREGTMASRDVGYTEWTGPTKCSYRGDVATSPLDGRWVSTLAGWSNGRLGPIYFLDSANLEQRSHVHYVLLIDPGQGSTFADGCDANTKRNPSTVLADWLALDPKLNKLVVISAQATAEDHHRGLQKYYLDAIKKRKLNKQVRVCNDDKLSHPKAFERYAADPAGSYITSRKFICPYGIPGWQP